MHQEMMALWTLIGIWKATDEGNGGCSNASTGKIIKRPSEGSTTPKSVSRYFFRDGHEWRTSNVDMVVGDYTKLSTILYVWVA